MEDLNEIMKQKRAKMNFWVSKGINPFAYSCKTTGSTKEIIARFLQGNKEVEKVAGRILAIRDHGKSIFVDVKDWEGNMQVYGKQDHLGEQFELFKNLEVGDICAFQGSLFTTKKGEHTMLVDSFELLSKSLRPLPEKYHGLKDTEVRYRKRYLDLIMNPSTKEIFEKRIKIIKEIRNYLDSKGFLEVETPILESVASGAAAKPFMTYSNALKQNLYLHIALELSLKRLIIGGMPKVYEINKVFRNEDIDTKHNPEFTLLEAYEAYTDYNGMMELCQGLFSHLLQSLGYGNKILYQGKEIDFTPPWKKIPMLDAIKEYAGIEIEYKESEREKIESYLKEDKVQYKPHATLGELIQHLFDSRVESKIVNPTFIIDYPEDISPLTKKHRSKPNMVERFELMINGMEFANAYSELTDPIDQKERFINQIKYKNEGAEETYEIDNEFVEAMEYGMPPTGGIGIGIDRLVMLLVNSASIKEVILFPQMKDTETTSQK